MVNFGLLAAEIVSLVWGTPGNFNGFRVLAALLHGISVVGVSQTAAFIRGRHLYSTGRPSGWALAHISSYDLYRWRFLSSICSKLPHLNTFFVAREFELNVCRGLEIMYCTSLDNAFASAVYCKFRCVALTRS